MKKEDLLQPQIEEMLKEINFIEKYKSIWEKYPYEGDDFKISNDQILDEFKKNGYEIRRYGKDQFFSDYIPERDFIYKIGITIKYNIIHFDISIRSEKLGVHLGGGFGLIVQLMTNWTMPVASPSFNNLESFKALLNDLIELFNFIKLNMEIRFKPE